MRWYIFLFSTGGPI